MRAAVFNASPDHQNSFTRADQLVGYALSYSAVGLLIDICGLAPGACGASSEAEIVHPTRKIRAANERYDINVARLVNELGGVSLAIYHAGGVTRSILDDLMRDRGITVRRVDIAGHTRISQVSLSERAGLSIALGRTGINAKGRFGKRVFRYAESSDRNGLVYGHSESVQLLVTGPPTTLGTRLPTVLT